MAEAKTTGARVAPPGARRVRKARVKSAQQLKVEALSKRYDQLPEVSGEVDKKKYEELRAELDIETKKLRRETFERVAGNYSAVVLGGIDKIAGLARSRRILMTEEDVDLLEASIVEAANSMATMLRGSLSHARPTKAKRTGVTFAPLPIT